MAHTSSGSNDNMCSTGAIVSRFISALQIDFGCIKWLNSCGSNKQVSCNHSKSFCKSACHIENYVWVKYRNYLSQCNYIFLPIRFTCKIALYFKSVLAPKAFYLFTRLFIFPLTSSPSDYAYNMQKKKMYRVQNKNWKGWKSMVSLWVKLSNFLHWETWESWLSAWNRRETSTWKCKYHQISNELLKAPLLGKHTPIMNYYLTLPNKV